MFAFSWLFVLIFCEYLVQSESTVSNNEVNLEVLGSNLHSSNKLITNIRVKRASNQNSFDSIPAAQYATAPQYPPPPPPAPQYPPPPPPAPQYPYPPYPYPPQTQYAAQHPPQYAAQHPPQYAAQPQMMYAGQPQTQYAVQPQPQYAAQQPAPLQYAGPPLAQYPPSAYQPPPYYYPYPLSYGYPPGQEQQPQYQIVKSKKHPLSEAIKGSVINIIKQTNIYAPNYIAPAGRLLPSGAPNPNPITDPHLIQQFLISKLDVLKDVVAILMGGDGESDLQPDDDVDELQGRESTMWATKPKLYEIPVPANKSRYMNNKHHQRKLFTFSSFGAHTHYHTYPKYGHYHRRYRRKPHIKFVILPK